MGPFARFTRSIRWACTLAFVFSVLACLSLRAASRDPWPEFPRTIPGDPALREGRLPNGLRYFVYPNSSPRDHIVMRLIVAAGSRNEQPGQYGVAHLIEHMAFRSARGSAYGALMQQLEHLGVGLGPGVTAYTYYDSTQYLLDLPKSDPTHLLTGLRLFRAFATDTHFDPSDVATEKQVVLNEQRMHTVEGDDSAFAYYGFLWPSVATIRRPTGGSASQIVALSAADCASFYAHWYRPERMAVIVVGSVDPEKTIAMLRDTLGDFSAKTPEAPPDPAPRNWIAPSSEPPRIAAKSFTSMHEVDLLLSRTWIERPVALTPGRELWETRLGLALAMFQQRMQELSLRPGYKMGSIILRPLNPYPALGFDGVQLSISGDTSQWKTTLRTLVLELRRAQKYGFTQREFDLARHGYLKSLEEGLRYWPTRQSDQVAAVIVQSLQSGRPFLTAQTIYDRLKAILAKTTLANCDHDFSEAWGYGRLPNIYLMAPPVVTVQRMEIIDALRDAMNARIDPRPDPKQAAFAYNSFGTPGRITDERHLADLDVWLDRFENGVRFNFKHTDFESDVVDAYIRVGTGRLSLPGNRPGLWLAAQGALLPGGLQRQTADQIAEITATRMIWLNFFVLDDALMFQLRSARDDLPLALKIVTAYIEDPALPSSVMPQLRVNLNRIYDRVGGTPSGVLSRDMEQILANGDPRFGLGRRSDALNCSISSIRHWLLPQLSSGPIEMSIVGDISYKDARADVATTIGALPRRDERPAEEKDGIRSFAPPDFYPLQGEGTPYQAGISYVWLLPWVRTMEQQRRINLLAEVLNQRLRSRLRESLGMSYVTGAQFVRHDGFKGFSYLTFYTEVNQQQLQTAVAVISAEFRTLAADGVSEDQFERSKSPWVSSYDSNLRQNAYWGGTVLADAQQRPANLAAARNRTVDTHGIKREEINRLLNRILDPASTLLFVIQMQQPQPAAP